ncbi:helix-turn-helix domain-containing protein [Rugamonas sp. FT82W]|uniref:Helix-turn-helix domain-containing protein n=1 Tax=Duganella vulcania TaxID=2692166 RepID=A0A845FXR6_9BURK|nr:IclR family transcriptional regulator C-terminal domain-containing protein [Duganella vulcania]MYM87313.1 helix-turn-helix domain-containing protein [Duganella vulcania]
MKKSALQDVVVDKRDQIEGLIKGLEVIRAFDHESVRLTPTELGEKVGLSRTAARRYLLTLVHMGMAATDGRTFWLRPSVLSIGHAYVDSARLPRAVVPYLQRLTNQLQESTNYSVLDGDDVVYVSRVNAPRILLAGFDPGMRLPAYTSTAGRVLLSSHSDETLQAYLERVTLIAYTHMTVTDKDQLFREIVAIREDGFGATENQYEMGLRGISVPVKNRVGDVVGALSTSMPASHGSHKEAIARCVPAMQAVANTLMLWV